jgi:hypothetical protein
MNKESLFLKTLLAPILYFELVRWLWSIEEMQAGEWFGEARNKVNFVLKNPSMMMPSC